ncbi:hypothetical protein BDV93DRAFT_516982, partial [Ceratobasidium sp. AG-I]
MFSSVPSKAEGRTPLPLPERPTGSKTLRAELTGKKVYPTFAGPTSLEKQALKDLATLSELNFTRFSTRQQTEDWAAKIPGILQAVLDIIGRGTGAAVYAYAAWDDMGTRTLITDATSLTLPDFIESPEAEGIRQALTRFSLEQIVLGPAFTRDWKKAWPVTYGLPLDDYRPRLPPRHSNHLEETWHFIDFCSQIGSWQGSYFIIPMSVLRQDIQSQTYAYIEQKRLPPGFTDFGGDYGEWQPSAIYTLTDWIRMQQERLDNGDKSAEESMFQHAQLKDKDGNTYLTVLSYQKEIATEHDLRYSAASAFYYAAISDAEP